MDPNPIRQISRSEPAVQPVRLVLLTPAQREDARRHREEARERRKHDRHGAQVRPGSADHRA
jgi:hypothetical protein